MSSPTDWNTLNFFDDAYFITSELAWNLVHSNAPITIWNSIRSNNPGVQLSRYLIISSTLTYLLDDCSQTTDLICVELHIYRLSLEMRTLRTTVVAIMNRNSNSCHVGVRPDSEIFMRKIHLQPESICFFPVAQTESTDTF